MKPESSFIIELEKKSREQRKLAETELIPNWARGIGDWLVENPWRVLIPTAGVFYIFLRMIFGSGYREFILGLFGGFVR